MTVIKWIAGMMLALYVWSLFSDDIPTQRLNNDIPRDSQSNLPLLQKDTEPQPHAR